MAAAFPIVVESGEEEILQDDMIIIDVDGDGNCLFYAILLSLQLTYPDLLIDGRPVVSYKNQTFINYLRNSLSDDPNLPYYSEKITQSILIDECYGNRETIKYLVGLLNINIRVYLLGTTIRSDFTSSEANPTINLINFNKHYNSVVSEASLEDPRISLDFSKIKTYRLLKDQYQAQMKIEKEQREYDKLVDLAKKRGITDADFMERQDLTLIMKEFLDREENQIDTSDDEDFDKQRVLNQKNEEIEIADDERLAIALQQSNPELVNDEEIAKLMQDSEYERKKYLKYKRKYLLLKKTMKKIEN